MKEWPATARVPTSTLPGIAMFSTAVLLFPGMDAIAKILARDISPYEVALLRFVTQTLFLALIHLALRRPLLVGMPPRTLATLAGAGVILGASTAFFFWGLVYLPLANALAIFFVQPLLVTLLAAVVLREPIGPHRIIAVAVGFVGTLVVIRPNVAAFGWAALLPALAALTAAMLLIIMRVTTKGLDALRVQFVSGAFAAVWIALGLLVGTTAGVPVLTYTGVSADKLGYVLGLGLFATVCQGLIVQAVKRTPPGVLAPFQYLEMFSAVLLGFVVFGDLPDALTLLGTTVILASGFYVFNRERRLSRAPFPAPEAGTVPPDPD